MGVNDRRILAALVGASVAWGAAGGLDRLRGREPPVGWVARHPKIPMFEAVDQLIGEGNGYALLDHTALVREAPGGSLSVPARVPQGARWRWGSTPGR